MINQHKVGKHFLTTITDDSFSFERDHDKIATEAELDGLYIVRSNVEPELFDADQTVRASERAAGRQQAVYPNTDSAADVGPRSLLRNASARRPMGRSATR